MFRRSLIPVWIGLVCILSSFLLGQQPWPTQQPSKLNVYDASDQYLGVLVKFESDATDIYVPSLEKFVRMDVVDSSDEGWILPMGTSGSRYWEATDCSGTPYFRLNQAQGQGLYEYYIAAKGEIDEGKYFVLDRTATTRTL